MFSQLIHTCVTQFLDVLGPKVFVMSGIIGLMNSSGGEGPEDVEQPAGELDK